MSERDDTSTLGGCAPNVLAIASDCCSFVFVHRWRICMLAPPNWHALVVMEDTTPTRPSLSLRGCSQAVMLCAGWKRQLSFVEKEVTKLQALEQSRYRVSLMRTAQIPHTALHPCSNGVPRVKSLSAVPVVGSQSVFGSPESGYGTCSNIRCRVPNAT
jgi:hypothetical protein